MFVHELYMKWETIWPNTAKDVVSNVSGLVSIVAMNQMGQMVENKVDKQLYLTLNVSYILCLGLVTVLHTL